jgi:hypothetical protein
MFSERCYDRHLYNPLKQWLFLHRPILRCRLLEYEQDKLKCSVSWTVSAIRRDTRKAALPKLATGLQHGLPGRAVSAAYAMWVGAFQAGAASVETGPEEKVDRMSH